jgi:hypothetical protein
VKPNFTKFSERKENILRSIVFSFLLKESIQFIPNVKSALPNRLKTKRSTFLLIGIEKKKKSVTTLGFSLELWKKIVF